MDEATLLLIRHAESTWNADRRWQGHGDPPLSERGRRQAAELAAALAGEAVEAVVSSDLARARETAEALARRLGCAVRVEPAFRELDVGRWNGLTRAQIQARDPEALARFDAEEPLARAGGGESREEVCARVRAAADALLREHADRCVALVTHLGVIRAILPGADPSNAEWRAARGETLRAAWAAERDPRATPVDKGREVA